MCGRVVYYVVGLCNVWLCVELCGRVVYYVLRWCTVV